MSHKLGVQRRLSGGGGTIHNLTVDEALNMLQNETSDNETLTSLADVTPTDFHQGLTVVGVNRCVNNPEVVTRTVDAYDLSENLDGEPTVPISLESLTSYYPLSESNDDPDVVRVITTTKSQ